MVLRKLGIQSHHFMVSQIRGQRLVSSEPRKPQVSYCLNCLVEFKIY